MKERNRELDLMLLAHAFYDNLMRDDIEYGGWGLDDKRPFGNSFVVGDIAEMLDLPLYVGGDELDSAGRLDTEVENYCHSLYDELGSFLTKQWKKDRSK